MYRPVTALHLFLYEKPYCVENFRRCLSQNPSTIEVKDFFGNTPLHRLILSWTSEEYIELLLNHGANVNTGDNENSTALILLLKQTSASEIWKKNVLQLFIKHGANLHALCKEGRSTVCYALRYANPVSVIESLLEAGCSLNNCMKHPSPIHCAADLYTKDYKLPDGTLLVVLRADTLKIVLNVFEENSVEFLDPTLVQQVLQNINFEIKAITWLLDRLQDCTVQDEFQNTLLHFACRNSSVHPSVLQTLIKRGVRVDRLNDNGNTALHESLSHSAPASTIEVLVENGSPIEMKNAFGETPLQLAVNAERVDILLLLLIAGSRVESLQLKRLVSVYYRSKNRLDCLKMLLKGHFLEYPDFDFQSLIKDDRSCNELTRFGFDCLSELRKLDSKSPFLREFIYKCHSHQLTEADFSLKIQSYFNKLQEIIEENECPLLSDIIIGKLNGLAKIIIPEVVVYTNVGFSDNFKKVPLNYQCVCQILKSLKNEDLRRLISAFSINQHVTHAQKEDTSDNKKGAENSE